MIRKLNQNDFAMWSKIYKNYAEFYKVPMNNEILEKLWGWIHDDIHIVKGICFEIDSKIVGIAHYRKCPGQLKVDILAF